MLASPDVRFPCFQSYVNFCMFVKDVALLLEVTYNTHACSVTLVTSNSTVEFAPWRVIMLSWHKSFWCQRASVSWTPLPTSVKSSTCFMCRCTFVHSQSNRHMKIWSNHYSWPPGGWKHNTSSLDIIGIELTYFSNICNVRGFVWRWKRWCGGTQIGSTT